MFPVYKLAWCKDTVCSDFQGACLFIGRQDLALCSLEAGWQASQSSHLPSLESTKWRSLMRMRLAEAAGILRGPCALLLRSTIDQAASGTGRGSTAVGAHSLMSSSMPV